MAGEPTLTKTPVLYEHVLQAVSRLGDAKGSSVKCIVDIVSSTVHQNNIRLGPYTVSGAIRKALSYGLQKGHLEKRGGAYRIRVKSAYAMHEIERETSSRETDDAPSLICSGCKKKTTTPPAVLPVIDKKPVNQTPKKKNADKIEKNSPNSKTSVKSRGKNLTSTERKGIKKDQPKRKPTKTFPKSNADPRKGKIPVVKKSKKSTTSKKMSRKSKSARRRSAGIPLRRQLTGPSNPRTTIMPSDYDLYHWGTINDIDDYSQSLSAENSDLRLMELPSENYDNPEPLIEPPEPDEDLATDDREIMASGSFDCPDDITQRMDENAEGHNEHIEGIDFEDNVEESTNFKSPDDESF